MGNPVRGVRPPTSFSATNAQMWNCRKQSKVECKLLWVLKNCVIGLISMR